MKKPFTVGERVRFKLFDGSKRDGTVTGILTNGINVKFDFGPVHSMALHDCTRLRPKKKKKRTVQVGLWANVYPSGAISSYTSREDADAGADEDRIACVRLTGSYEVGE